jgi:hypothetical protein
VLVGEGVDRLLKRRLEGAPPLRWRALGELGVALLASLAVLALNPNGLALYGYPFYTLSLTALSRYVMEWFPASLDTLFGQLLAGFAIVAVLPTLIFGRRRLRTADALILVGLTVMAYQAIRFLLIVGPIGAAIAAVVLSPVISATGFGQRMSGTLERLSRPRTGRLGSVNAVLIGLLVLVGVGVSLARVNPATQAAEIARGLPVAAVAWMNEHDPGDRVFNRYEWGGYIGQHRPDKPIFMDGRADLYGDDLLKMYVSVIGLDGDPQVVLDRYRIDHAVVPPDWALAHWFDESPLWKRVYEDSTAAIWERK